MKFFLIFIISIFLISCSTNKVIKKHGIAGLKLKTNKIYVNKSNKNDISNILGPPSTKSNFDENLWIYIERKKINQSVFKLGKRKIYSNNVLVLKFSFGPFNENISV